MSFEGKVEYAKTGRASCKKCKQNIAQHELRLARMVNSPFTDGKVPAWHHFDCFWEKKFPVADVSQFQGFSEIKFDDQERIRNKIGANSGGAGKIKGKTTVALPLGCPELVIEYAKSSRSECRLCFEKIMKDEIRCGPMKPSDSGRVAFDVPHWCHRKCFAEIIQTDEYADIPLSEIVPEMFTGHQLIKAEDKKDFMALLNAARTAQGMEKLGGKKSAKRKANDDTEVKETKKAKAEETKTKLLLKEQSERLWEIRDALKGLSTGTLKIMLEQNGQNPSGSAETLQARLAEALAYGAFQKCPECNENKWETKEDGYHCMGNLDEFSPCIVVTRTPPAKKFKVDKTLVKHIQFFKNFKPSTAPRIFDPRAVELAEAKARKARASSAPAASAPSGGAKGSSAHPNSKFVIAVSGKLKRSVAECKDLVKNIGMTWYAGKIGSHVTCLVSTQSDFNKKPQAAKIKDAMKFNVPIVSEGFLTECEKLKGCGLLQPYLIACSSTVIEPSLETSRRAAFEQGKSVAKGHQSTLLVKGRAAVEIERDDREFGHLVESHHVLDVNGIVWSASLNMVNTRDNLNSYYKMQILEADNGGGRWKVFKRWGRVGTAIGNTKMEDFYTKHSAMDAFASTFFEKTGNTWEDREKFKKRAGKFNYVPVAYSDGPTESLGKQLKNVAKQSNLQPEVQDLVKLLFDTSAIEQTMKEMDVDLTKMPLGRLNRKSIEAAFEVLSNIETALKIKKQAKREREIHVNTNKFYQIIPHDFGMKTPPPIDNDDILKAKIELVESLLEIELTSRMIKTEDEIGGSDKHPLDTLHDKLNTKIKAVPKDSEIYSLVEKYAKNTHAATHSQYSLEIESIFEVKRKAEKQAYKKHKSLHNKRLLWHGSRLTNWVGILSEGLRIAPPSAPVTGYMFGKGVYFADMVSKSANYCQASHSQPTGLLLLSEVALGSMHECTQSQYVVGPNQSATKDQDAGRDFVTLPPDKHSTFGVGSTAPNKDHFETTEDGVLVPCGPPSKSGVRSSLLYNEYIVYDTSQIKMKYLVRARFKFKSRSWY